MECPIIDGDTHINEPPDLWQKRVPARLRDRAPRVVKAEHGGVAWSFEEGQKVNTITPTSNVLGLSPVKWTLSVKDFHDLPAGAYDPEQRVKDMAIDKIDVHVLYPTYVMGGAQIYSRKDRDLQKACVRAYNDWISEFATHSPEKLWALATLPVTGVEDAMEEARRAKDLPGIKGIQLTAFPNGHAEPRHQQDDPFWNLVEELDIPVTIHVGFQDGGEVEEMAANVKDSIARLTLPRLNSGRQAVPTIPVLSHFVLGGILERHPRLRLGLAEVGVGWIPFFMEQTDFNYVRHRFWSQGHLKKMPSEYVLAHVTSTIQEDYYGLRNRDLMLPCILWSSDYPHSGSDWPNSRVSIANQMRGIPPDQQEAILSGNARRFFAARS